MPDGGRGGGKRSGGWGGGGGSGGGGGKKGRWHRPSSSSAVIPYGNAGVMVTCEQGKERAACRDLARALDEAYELRFPDGDEEAGDDGDDGDATKDDTTKDPSADTKKPSSADPGDLLAAEIAQLKETKTESKRFNYLNLDFKACAFVTMCKSASQKVSPSDLVHDVLQKVRAGEGEAKFGDGKKEDEKEDDEKDGDSKDDVAKGTPNTLVPKSRYALRVVPADDVCFAGIEEIKKCVGKMIAKRFPALEGMDDAFVLANKVKFAVHFASRANSSLRRTEVIEAVASLVPVGHQVDLTNPTLTIAVEVVKGTVCVAILKSYPSLFKYNWRMCGLNEQERNSERARNSPPGGGGAEAKE